MKSMDIHDRLMPLKDMLSKDYTLIAFVELTYWYIFEGMSKHFPNNLSN